MPFINLYDTYRFNQKKNTAVTRMRIYSINLENFGLLKLLKKILVPSELRVTGHIADYTISSHSNSRKGNHGAHRILTTDAHG